MTPSYTGRDKYEQLLCGHLRTLVEINMSNYCVDILYNEHVEVTGYQTKAEVATGDMLPKKIDQFWCFAEFYDLKVKVLS